MVVPGEGDKKKCPVCNRVKGLHLFYKSQINNGNYYCKACYKKYQSKRRADMKAEDYNAYRAKHLRSNWRRRAVKLELDLNEIPSIPKITEWLDDQMPYTCYLTGDPLDRDFQVDHRVSITRGGGFGLDNLGLTSQLLNGAKGSMIESEFRELLNLVESWDNKGESLLSRLQASNSVFNKGKK